ncbi:hypothetical protein ACFCX0_08060 [Streptomyces sp. NPDC056352]|uniref:hypothetical protein n=1 Tax=Streptomyces sp. NPDC056352 TaxID=3345791 RepID=UPI0035D892CE
MSEDSPHRRPIRVAIVGTDAIARDSHLPALTALAAEQPLQISAAVDVNAGSVEAFCADAGIGHPYTDLDLMPAEQRPDFGPDVASSHEAQLRGPLDDLRPGRRPCSSSGADDRTSLELVAALYKAAFTGATVRAGEIGSGDPYYSALHGSAADWAPEPSAVTA